MVSHFLFFLNRWSLNWKKTGLAALFPSSTQKFLVCQREHSFRLTLVDRFSILFLGVLCCSDDVISSKTVQECIHTYPGHGQSQYKSMLLAYYVQLLGRLLQILACQMTMFSLCCTCISKFLNTNQDLVWADGGVPLYPVVLYSATNIVCLFDSVDFATMLTDFCIFHFMRTVVLICSRLTAQCLGFRIEVSAVRV